MQLNYLIFLSACIEITRFGNEITRAFHSATPTFAAIKKGTNHVGPKGWLKV